MMDRWMTDVEGFTATNVTVGCNNLQKPLGFVFLIRLLECRKRQSLFCKHLGETDARQHCWLKSISH